jgi:hypothetical protein
VERLVVDDSIVRDGAVVVRGEGEEIHLGRCSNRAWERLQSSHGKLPSVERQRIASRFDPHSSWCYSLLRSEPGNPGATDDAPHRCRPDCMAARLTAGAAHALGFIGTIARLCDRGQRTRLASPICGVRYRAAPSRSSAWRSHFAVGHEKRGIPPMIEERRERDAHFADDLRPQLQGVTGLAPRREG